MTTTAPETVTERVEVANDVWKLENVEDTYWHEYIATRPKNEPVFMNRIYNYHAQHSLSFDAAIDVGAGAGDTAEALCKKFTHVVASDNDACSQGFIKKRYADLILEGKLSLKLSTGEEILSHYPPASFDLITAAECFVLMDTQPALSAFWHLLRPSGTLAIWFYGRPTFTEPEFNRTCQPIFDKIMDREFRPVVSGHGGGAASMAWKRAVDGMASWLDYIPFDPRDWKDVRRHKWNTAASLPFYLQDACDFPVEPYASSVKQGETCTEERYAPDHWKKEWDIAWVRRFLWALFPKSQEVRKKEEQDLELAGWIEELEQAMGGRDAVRQLSWPSVLVLATKNDGDGELAEKAKLC